MAGNKASWWWLGGLAAAIVGLGVGIAQVQPAVAQSGWWPWSSEPAPVRRPPPRRDPQPSWNQDSAPAQRYSRGDVCLQLEQRLVDQQRQANGGRNQMPDIDAQLRQAERALRSSERALDRADCYDQFFFSRTLRRSRRCIGLSNDVSENRQRVADLDSQRRQYMGSSSRDRSYQDDLIRELARNNCGAQYAREAARRQANDNPFSSLWQDEDSSGSGSANTYRSLPFATYRTVCVRLCDGYFFPVSFSTLQSHFARDMETCQSKCAAPVDLFYYQNPGGNLDQAQSYSDRRRYTSLKTAFKYRKEFVQGCSCKQSEYTPSPTDTGGRRTDAGPQSGSNWQTAQQPKR
ncbi:MAG: DUF2865 domain-containing protein [Hyphomicrobiaceae bacterium]